MPDNSSPQSDATLGSKHPHGREGLEDPEAMHVDRAEFHKKVAAKQKRSRRAREEGDRGMKSGWGAFGIVGWSIAVPMLLGIAAGIWLDRRLGGGSRYTLSLLALGLVMGMANVWKWMNTE